MTDYYDGDGCWRAIEDAGFGEGFNRGNVLKYLWRAGRKSPGLEGEIEDLRKARSYLDREINRLESALHWQRARNGETTDSGREGEA